MMSPDEVDTLRAEIVRLREEFLAERAWREELQAFTIDQALEIVELKKRLGETNGA